MASLRARSDATLMILRVIFLHFCVDFLRVS